MSMQVAMGRKPPVGPWDTPRTQSIRLGWRRVTHVQSKMIHNQTW